MTFKQVDRSLVTGTSLRGELRGIKFEELIDVFGQPNKGSGDGKVQYQWVVEISGGVIVTIYDYKTQGDARTLSEWHVGGKTDDAVQLLSIIIDEQRRTK